MNIDNNSLIRVRDPNRTWIISDTHFGHDKIRDYAQRPFEDMHSMDEYMVDRWNENVRNNLDIVYHLGDFCFGKAKDAARYFERLNGKICILTLLWHHDNSWMHNMTEVRSKSGDKVTFLQPTVVLVMPSGFYQVNGHPRSMFLSHYPNYIWHHKHYLSWHVYGHSHDAKQVIPGSPLAMNVNVEATHMNYGPISIADIGKRLSRIEQNLGLKPAGIR